MFQGTWKWKHFAPRRISFWSHEIDGGGVGIDFSKAQTSATDSFYVEKDEQTNHESIPDYRFSFSCASLKPTEQKNMSGEELFL